MKTLRKLSLIFLLLSVFSFAFASDYYTGKGQEDKSFFMLEPSLKNVGSVERAWLPSAITPPLKTGLKLFTGMTPVNFENTAQIQDIQKKVESGAYDGSRAVVEAGKLQDANYGVFVTVTKTSNAYQLAVSVTNLTTGREEATAVVNNILKETDLQDAAINAAIIQLAPQLGVKLTSLGLYTLSNSSDGSLDEQIQLAKQEAASYQATIDALNKELASFNSASALTDQDALAKKAAAETEKQLYEQRQLAAQQKAQRLLEQKQKADEEAMAAMARSTEATQKLGQLSKEAENIAAQVRAKQASMLSVEERITLIENKKAAYMQIRAQIEAEEDSYWNLANEEYQKGYVDPYDPANYPTAFYQNGVMNTDYQNMLIKQNDDLANQCRKEAYANIERAKAATGDTLDTLLDEIRSDIANLSKTKFTLSSLSTPEIFSISTYDVNNYLWNAQLIFYMFNDSCPVIDFSLSYENVTGEAFPKLTSKAAFDEYAATYDIYDAMFRMGTPFLTLEMDYSVMADDDDYPSCYIISPTEYRITRTADNKQIRKERITDNDMTLQYYPITDMSGIGETVAVNEIRQAEKKKEAARQAEEEKRAEKERIAYQKELDYWLQPDLGYGPGIWGAFTYSRGAGQGIGFDAGVDLKFPGFSLNMGSHSIPTAANTSVICMDFGFLRDREFNLFGKKSNWFWGIQVGPAFFDDCPVTSAGNNSPYTLTNINMYHSSSSNSSTDDLGIGFSMALNAGIFIPINWNIAWKLQYSTQMLGIGDSAYWYDRFSIGIALFLLEGESAEDFWGD